MFSDGKRASDRAIELILAFYSAFNRGDWEGMLAMLSEDVAHDLNQGQREIGREAFRTYITRMQRCYSEQLRNLVVTTTPDGTHAAAEYVVHGEYKTDDASAGPPSTGSSQVVVLPPAKGQRYVLPGGASSTCAATASRASPTTSTCRIGCGSSAKTRRDARPHPPRSLRSA